MKKLMTHGQKARQRELVLFVLGGCILVGGLTWHSFHPDAKITDGAGNHIGSYFGQVDDSGFANGEGILYTREFGRFTGNFRHDPAMEDSIYSTEYDGTWAFTCTNEDGTLLFGSVSFENAGIYTGEFIENSIAGTGHYTFADGERLFSESWSWGSMDDSHIGMLDNNQAAGYGVKEYDHLTLSDGTVLTGEYRGEFTDGQRNGYGQFHWSDGNCYEGTWRDDALFYGTYTYADGRTYTGEYLDNQQSGYGVYHGNDGRVYEGTWTAGSFDGTGTLTYANGDVYSGSWVNHARSGDGTMEWKSVSGSYTGAWEDDRISGIGTYTSTLGTGDTSPRLYQWVTGSLYEEQVPLFLDRETNLFYSGMVSEGSPHGYGTLSDKNKLVHIDGEFYDGKLHGTVVITYANGAKYTLQANHGQLSTPEYQVFCLTRLDDKTLKDNTRYKVKGGETVTFTYTSCMSDIAFLGWYFNTKEQTAAKEDIVDITDGRIIGQNGYGQNIYEATITLPQHEVGYLTNLLVEPVASNDYGVESNVTKSGWLKYTFEYVKELKSSVS